MGLYGLRSELAYLRRKSPPAGTHPVDAIRHMRKVALLNVARVRYYGFSL